MKGACKQKRERFFIWSNSERTKGNGFKLKEGRFRLDVRKKYSEVVRHWHGLPRAAVGTPSPKVFLPRLEGALSSLSWWAATSA